MKNHSILMVLMAYALCSPIVSFKPNSARRPSFRLSVASDPRVSRNTETPLIDKSSKAKENLNREREIESKRNAPHRWSSRSLTVFIVDTSMPGGSKRIEAVQGAVSGIIPGGKVSVMVCYENSAEVLLDSSSSLLDAKRRLSPMKQSFMGNLGAGMQMAVESTKRSIARGEIDSVHFVIVGDGKAHGILQSVPGCEEESLTEACDVELLTNAGEISDMVKNIEEANKLNIRSFVFDTEKVRNAEWSESGARLASMCSADYYHDEHLTDTRILHILAQNRV
jgi:Mg-chelatase subunit ChlD